MKSDPEDYIHKQDLVHGAYYYGECRNAEIARWNGTREKFLHWRYKFSHIFIEEISCPEDEQNYDVFFAFARLESKPLNIKEIEFNVR